MLTALLTAIQTAYAASALPTSLEGLYFGAAPQGTTGDYGVVSVPASAFDWASGVQWEEVSVQFSLFTPDASPIGLLAVADTLTTTFDFAQLSITGGTMLWMHRESGPLPIADPDGGWQVITTYNVRLEEA